MDKKLLLLWFCVACGSNREGSIEPAALPKTAIPDIRLQTVAEGLRSPVGLFNAGDGSGRLFIIEQAGTIRILSGGKLTPFLDIADRVTSGGEKGLLGLAFHPKFRENGRFFVNYTSDHIGEPLRKQGSGSSHTPRSPALVRIPGSPKIQPQRPSRFRPLLPSLGQSEPDTRLVAGGLQTVISEFNGGAGSERILLTIPQPFSNHNGGSIVFGSDGFLYIGMGDGGSGNDPFGNGQSLKILLGKMLRIDVDRAEGGKPYGLPSDNPFIGRKDTLPEIWAYGLRNPWRFSFDPATRLLYAGDVGQSAREEIDIVAKGKNYGWNIMEGTICTPGVNPNCDKSGLEPPIFDYPRSEGTTVIGGYVYRGASVPGLAGVYIYGDFGNGRIFGLRYDGRSVTEQRTILETGRSISAFGEDEQREIYVVDYSGMILKILSAK